MTNLRELLAFNMRERRHFLRISQEKLAENIGTSTNYIGMIETRKKFPTPEMLERIAFALGIDAPDLFSTKKHPAKTPVLQELYDSVIKDIEKIIAYKLNRLE
jgi:transcriptional regulator with XRE-family HTH domain